MKRFDIINNIVDEETFRNEFVNEMPSQWDAELNCSNGDYYITVDDIAEEPMKRLLKANNIRYMEFNVTDREYNGYNVTIAESSQYYYIDFNTGLGDGIYPKEDWTLEEALKDQANIYKEN